MTKDSVSAETPLNEFTAQDYQDLKDIKDEIWAALRLRREGTYQVAEKLVAVRDRGLHTVDECKDVHAWAWKIFRIRRRQADKYLLIGDQMTRPEVVDFNLTIDQQCQVAQATRELRPVLRDLGEEGLNPSSLYAGRCAGEEELRKGLEALLRERGPGPHPIPQEVVLAAGQAAEKAARACEAGEPEQPVTAQVQLDTLLQRLEAEEVELQVIRALMRSGHKVPEARVMAVMGVVERLRAELLLTLSEARAWKPETEAGAKADTGPVPASECQTTAGPAAPGQEAASTETGATSAQADVAVAAECQDQDATAPAPKGPAAPDLESIVRATVYHAEFEDQFQLSKVLCSIVRGEDPEQHLGFFEELHGRWQKAGAGVSRESFTAWTDRLVRRGRTERGRFALWFYRRARLPQHQKNLIKLREAEMPGQLREVLERELALFRGPEPGAEAAQGGAGPAPG